MRMALLPMRIRRGRGVVAVSPPSHELERLCAESSAKLQVFPRLFAFGDPCATLPLKPLFRVPTEDVRA